MSVSADLIYSAIAVRPTAGHTYVATAHLSRRTVAVTRTGLSARAVDALLALNALDARRPTFESLAHMTGLTVGTVDAVTVPPFTTHYRCGRAFESKTTTTGQVVIDYRTDGIRSANAFDFTRVLTSVLNACLTGLALGIVSTADITVALRDTGLVRWTTVVDNAGLDAEVVETSFTRRALSVQSTDEATLTVDTGLTVAAIGICRTESRYSGATAQRVGFSSEIVGADTFGLVVTGYANSVGTALESFARVLT